MNCYLCRRETGNGLRPALAVCQRCGAGVCEAHLVDLSGTTGVSLAGASSAIICSRCCGPLSQQRSRGVRPSPSEENGGSRSLLQTVWNWFSRRGPTELPEPAEVVKEVERFLHRQRRREAEEFTEPDADG